MVVFFVSVGVLSAGLVVRTQEVNAAGVVVSENEIFCKGDYLALNLTGEDRVVFNAKERVFTVVVGSQRSYLEIGEAEIERFGEVIANAQRQVEQALQAVPASQRERMRQMMASRMPGLGNAGRETAELNLEAMGQEREISGYETRGYRVLSDGQRVAEFWIASWADFDGGDELRANLSSMAGFMQNMLDMMPNMGVDFASDQDVWIRTMDSLDGFPVKSLHFDGSSNRPVKTTTLVLFESRELAEDVFSVPDGFRKQNLELPSF